MSETISALLVYHEETSLRPLQVRLEHQGIETFHAQSCKDAQCVLDQPEPQQLVFTDRVLPDGTWADVVALAAKTRNPVIVVSRFVDLQLYIDAMEQGEFDFMVPPFADAGLAHIVRSAAWSAAHHTGPAHMRTAQRAQAGVASAA